MDRIPVIRGNALRDRTPTVVGAMPVEVLIKYQKFALYKPDEDRGYQREPEQKRVQELTKALREGDVDLPTAILLSLRVEYQEVIEESKDGNLILKLDPTKANGEHALYVVDGQHRVKALEKAIEGKDDKSLQLRDVRLPFVCMVGASEYQELNQFHIINSKARPVSTDLSWKLLRKRFGKGLLSESEERRGGWMIAAQGLVERLEQEGVEWKGRIQSINKPKGSSTIKSNALAKSMQPLFKQCASFEGSEEDQRYRIIAAYWQGIRRVLPHPFENPRGYHLQTSLGAYVMHLVARFVIALIPAERHYSPEAYAKILGYPLSTLSGKNGRGKSVKGSDFWLRGGDGCSGSYKGTSGRRDLAEKIKERLPKS